MQLVYMREELRVFGKLNLYLVGNIQLFFT